MKKLFVKCLSLALGMLVLFSCKDNGGKTMFTPVSSGRPYEMLVVIDKAMWERPAGRALFNVLDTDVPGLPQPERSFRISNIGPEHFDRGMRIFRNIIDVDIQPIYTQPIALVPFNVPGIMMVLPFSSFIGFPVTLPPSRCGRPFSLTSKAIALARRVEVVFKL